MNRKPPYNIFEREIEADVLPSAVSTAYFGGPSGFWVKSKQSDMLSAEPSRWLIDGTPKFSSQNLTMLTKECSVFEI